MRQFEGRFSILSIGSLLACLLMVSGCGGSSGEAQISGKVTQNGQPLEVSDQGEIVMVFYELANGQVGERSYLATAQRSGTYQAALPPGEYRVGVQLMDPYVEHVDKLRGAYGQMKSPVTVQITEESTTVDIELNRT